MADDDAARTRPLTVREREVLTWVAQGKSASQISAILHISKRTVDEHAQSALRKLNAANRVHAVAIALREHVIEYHDPAGANAAQQLPSIPLRSRQPAPRR